MQAQQVPAVAPAPHPRAPWRLRRNGITKHSAARLGVAQAPGMLDGIALEAELRELLELGALVFYPGKDARHATGDSHVDAIAQERGDTLTSSDGGHPLVIAVTRQDGSQVRDIPRGGARA